MVPLADLEAARARLPAQVRRTPLLLSEELSEQAGVPVYFKCENLQVTGSYKARGAHTILDRLPPEQRARGAAITSSGNFATAFAYMGRLLGIPAYAVVAERTSPLKLERIRGYGAEIVTFPDTWESRWATLERLQAERGIAGINTYESPDVIAGHGSLGLEIVEQLPEVECVLVPVSSGGLIGGVATAVKEKCPKARIIGLQPSGNNAAVLSFQQRRVVTTGSVDTICDALVAQAPGKLLLEQMLEYVDEMTLVEEAAVAAALPWLAKQAKLVVETGGAVGAAALLSGAARPSGPTVVVLSGGNIALPVFARYLEAE